MPDSVLKYGAAASGLVNSRCSTMGSLQVEAYAQALYYFYTASCRRVAVARAQQEVLSDFRLVLFSKGRTIELLPRLKGKA